MALSVSKFEARAFRSLRAISYPMSNLDVFVGPNGVGKTNLYRALELLQSAARNTLAHDLARQGGLASAMWAGARRRSDPARLRLAVELSERASGGAAAASYRYEVEVGFPPPAAAAFLAEPQIKAESVSHVGRARTVRLMDRQGASVMARAESGKPERIDIDLLDSETVLGRLEDPSRFPALDAMRRTILQWRFYHGFRTDADPPALSRGGDADLGVRRLGPGRRVRDARSHPTGQGRSRRRHRRRVSWSEARDAHP